MACDILGVGTVVPPNSLEQSLGGEMVTHLHSGEEREKRLMTRLYARTGVEKRHSVILERSTGSLTDRQSFYPPLQDATGKGPTTRERMCLYEEHAIELATTSATKALQTSDVAASRVTHLVTVSCSGFAAPGFDIGLIRELDLAPTTQRTHVGFMGCHGALNGLRVARAFVEADPKAVALVCATEICSLHYQYTDDNEQMISNALFADGSASLVVAAGDGPWTIRDNTSCVVGNSEDFMTWRLADHGFQMSLSAQLPGLIVKHLPGWLGEWLASHDLTRDDIAGWAVHPGGPRILSAVHEALQLDDADLEVSRSILRDFGNMSSPTILFLLDRMRSTGVTGPIVALGFGPGITIEAALLDGKVVAG